MRDLVIDAAIDVFVGWAGAAAGGLLAYWLFGDTAVAIASAGCCGAVLALVAFRALSRRAEARRERADSSR